MGRRESQDPEKGRSRLKNAHLGEHRHNGCYLNYRYTDGVRKNLRKMSDGVSAEEVGFVTVGRKTMETLAPSQD
jgi:hypothetical protein